MMATSETPIPDDIDQQILNAVTKLTDVEFNNFFDCSNLFIYDYNSFIYGYNSLSPERQKSLKHECLDALINDWSAGTMYTPVVFNRSVKLLEFMHKISTRGKMVEGFNDYAEFFIYAKESVAAGKLPLDCLIDAWSYMAEALDGGLLNPVQAAKDDIEIYLKLGNDMAPHMSEHMSWWLPIYLGIPLIHGDLDHYIEDFNFYSEIPPKQLDIYKGLGLSTVDCIIQYHVDKHCETPTAHPLIELS